VRHPRRHCQTSLGKPKGRETILLRLEVKRAVRILGTDRMEHTLEPDEIAAEMQRLNPPRPEGAFPDIPPGCDRYMPMGACDLLAKLKDMCNAVAPGCTGWTEELLYAAASTNAVFLEKLCLITCDIRNGDVHERAAHKLLTGEVTPGRRRTTPDDFFLKKKGEKRPKLHKKC
jgi:hypothetical protein